jgi:hypothetical protein
MSNTRAEYWNIEQSTKAVHTEAYTTRQAFFILWLMMLENVTTRVRKEWSRTSEAKAPGCHDASPMILMPSRSLSSFSLTMDPTTPRAGARNANTCTKVAARQKLDMYAVCAHACM